MEDPQAQLEKEKIIELYQNTTLAKCLADELQEQIDQNKITVRDAQKIMEIFDNQLYEQMQLFSQQQSRIEGTVSGTLDMFRFCEGVSDLECSDVTVTYTKPESRQPRTSQKVFIKSIDTQKRRGARR